MHTLLHARPVYSLFTPHGAGNMNIDRTKKPQRISSHLPCMNIAKKKKKSLNLSSLAIFFCLPPKLNRKKKIKKLWNRRKDDAAPFTKFCKRCCTQAKGDYACFGGAEPVTQSAVAGGKWEEHVPRCKRETSPRALAVAPSALRR